MEAAKETWIAVARPIKEAAEKKGLVEIIESSGALFADDTCFVVAPIKGRFKCMATNSAKSVFYARSKNQFKTVINKQVSLIYRYKPKKGEIELVLFWDNRREPSQLKH